MSMDLIYEMIQVTLEIEGGLYTGDGLNTKYGIVFQYNKRELAKFGIYTASQIRELTEQQATEIYINKYLKSSKCELFLCDINLAWTIFDFAVNAGASRACRAIQEMINFCLSGNDTRINKLVIDGKIGPKSIEAIRYVLSTHDTKMMTTMYNQLRKAHYMSILNYRRSKGKYTDKKLCDFLQSWFRRCKIAF